ncbi:hypothetical protein [Streptomyces sp. NPDC018045]|uniref:hypothetical protein n=1 Tax=Streptomyces sp. NPDC018045 TaxID=3365037 RepID=UPI00379F5F51
MPRKRPGRIRAHLPRRRRSQDTTTVMKGLSSRALAEIGRLEHTRNHLQPGDVGKAVRLWEAYVHRPKRELWHDFDQLWHDDKWCDLHWHCCGNPLEARKLLDVAQQALPHYAARELRKAISRLDAFWTLPSPTSVIDER